MSGSNKLFLIALIVLPVLATGCDTLGSEDEDPVAGAVYVANQGNFTDGNGSVTAYDPATEEASHNIYGLSGTTVQSLTLHEGRVYVIANSGGYVNVYDAESNEQIAQMQTPNPRYMAVASDEKAYVTNQLYGRSSMVSVIDLSTHTVVDSVEVGGSPDGITVAGDRAYVALGTFGASSKLAVIDTDTDAVIDTLDAECDSPRSLFTDAQEEVWVVCTGVTTYGEDGSVTGRTDGAVRVVDGATGEVVKRFAVDGRLGAASLGHDVYYAPGEEEAYVIKGESRLLRFDTEANVQADELAMGGAPIGAVAYDAERGHIYVGHVPSFTDDGTVSIHQRDGAQVGSFPAGKIPTYIALGRPYAVALSQYQGEE